MLHVSDCVTDRHSAPHTRADRMPAHRKLDQRRVYFCAAGLRKRASCCRFILCSEVNERSSVCFSREQRRLLFRTAIFAKQKTNTVEQEKHRHVIKAAKEISMQHLILLVVVSMMVLYVLIIVGCLCCVGRHGRRTA